MKTYNVVVHIPFRTELGDGGEDVVKSLGTHAIAGQEVVLHVLKRHDVCLFVHVGSHSGASVL